MGDARHLAGNAAKADQADGFSGQLPPFHAQPLSAADGAVHAGQAARGPPHQRDGVLGHGGVAIALDDVHGDAVGGEFLGVHVAARAGAQEDDVLQVAAPGHPFCRHIGPVVQHEMLPGEQVGQLFGRHLVLDVHPHDGVPRPADAAHDFRKLVRGVDKQALHGNPRAADEALILPAAPGLLQP